MSLRYCAAFIFSLTLFLCAELTEATETKWPVEGMVTMVDLGATHCIPCKMMAPVLEKLEKEYEGLASIVFIDVYKNRDQADRFKIQVIPTQIFFDATGKEVRRHVGFMSEEAIVAQLRTMDVPKPSGKK